MNKDVMTSAGWFSLPFRSLIIKAAIKRNKYEIK